MKIFCSLLLFSMMISLNSKTQTIPKYFSPDGLVLYSTFKNNELNGETIKTTTRYPFNPITFGEHSKVGNIDLRSFDRESEQREYFIEKVKINSKKIDFLQPITIGFWVSSQPWVHDKPYEGNPTIRFEKYINDRLSIDFSFTDTKLSFNIEQKDGGLYQKKEISETLQEKIKPLEYKTSSNSAIKRKNNWYLIVLEFDTNSFKISINGERLKVYNLDFFKKSDFKEKYPSYDFKYHATGFKSDDGLFLITDNNRNFYSTINLDDLFIYQRLLTNEEISGIAYSRINQYYLKPIRDSINNIHTSLKKIGNKPDMKSILTFLENDFSGFSKYVKETNLNEIEKYPIVQNRDPRSNINPTLDSLFKVEQNITSLINNKIDLFFTPLNSNPSKEIILSTFNEYKQIEKENIDQKFLFRFKDSFGKMVREYFYNTLENKNSVTENIFFKTQSELLEETKRLYKIVTNQEFDLEYNLINNPPRSGTIRYKSSTKDFVRNPTVNLDEFNKDRKVLINEKSHTVKWNEKQLNFSNFKLTGNNQFFDSGALVYEYEFKENKLYSETWNYYTLDDVYNFMNVYDAKYYYNWGEIMYAEGNYSRALIAFDVAIKLDSKSHEYYYSRGITRGNLELYSEAMDDIKIAINLNPKSEYYWTRGVLNYNFNNVYDAYDDLTTAKNLGFIDKNNTFDIVKEAKEKLDADYELKRKKAELTEQEKRKESNEITNEINNILGGIFKEMVDGATGEWEKNPKNCHYCKGKGVVSVCPLCEKRGKIQCKKCKGKKVLYDGTVCIQCYGSGIQTCSGCNGKIYNIKCQHTIWQFQK